MISTYYFSDCLSGRRFLLTPYVATSLRYETSFVAGTCLSQRQHVHCECFRVHATYFTHFTSSPCLAYSSHHQVSKVFCVVGFSMVVSKPITGCGVPDFVERFVASAPPHE